jgi:hypothetical protein
MISNPCLRPACLSDLREAYWLIDVMDRPDTTFSWNISPQQRIEVDNTQAVMDLMNYEWRKRGYRRSP